MSKPLVNPEIIIWARKRNGFTVEALAKSLKLDPHEIAMWEKGDKSPSYATLEKLAYKHFKIPIALFLFAIPPAIEDPRNNFRRNIFRTPNEEELSIVKDILSDHRFRGLIRRESILKGLPVADPFIIAAAKVHNGMVVTQENYKPDAARIPTVCEVLKVRCINLEQFLKREKLRY
jgi:transcriptional regulator with XRE-family HTH domain